MDLNLINIINNDDAMGFVLSTSHIADFSYDNSLLYHASQKGNLSIVKYLVQKNANIDSIVDNPLFYACYYNKFKIVKYLVEYGADIHINNDNALYYASSFKYLEVVNYLLLNGGKPEVVKVSFIREYYLPTTLGNVLRLYNLQSKGVDIAKLKLIDVDQFFDKLKFVETSLSNFTCKDVKNVIIEYLM